MTKIRLGKSVLEAARERMEFVFNEFPRVVIGSSGGKDSTVVLELALEHARKVGRLPLDVMWLDQEAEWKSTVNYFRSIRKRSDIRLHWFQVPFKTNNSSSSSEKGEWLYAWEDGAKWMRDRDPDTITDKLKYDRFKDVLQEMPNYIYKGEPAAVLTGMRAEESPMRYAAVTVHNVYKGVTWASRGKYDYYRFHPIYDWSWKDIWTAIHEFGWEYNTAYDEYYRKGVPFKNMRVSSLTHEIAIQGLKHVQEMEPETWDKVIERLPGVHGCGNMAEDWFPDELPEMFGTWREYRNHLLNTIIEPHRRPYFNKMFASHDRDYLLKGFVGFDKAFCQAHCHWMATNDWEGVKAQSFLGGRTIRGFVRWTQGITGDYWTYNNPHIPVTA